MSSINNNIKSQITIDANTAHQRLDRFLRKYFRQYPDISLVMIFKAIRTGQIKVSCGTGFSIYNDSGTSPEGQQHGNPKRVDQSYSLKIGDIITFHPSFLELLTQKNPIQKRKKAPLCQEGGWGEVDFQSRIISEDDDRLIINKPAGISIHPGQKYTKEKSPSLLGGGLGGGSLYDLIKQYYSSRGFAGSMFQPNVAYRLDKETSGLVIVAKTYSGLQHLNTCIREHRVDKSYYAIVIGTFPKQLTCHKPMKKIVDKQFGRGKMVISHPSDPDAQTAHTIAKVEKTRSDPVLGPLSLVQVTITTGRMHQIRVHLADAGYPVLGDIVYGVASYNRKLQKTYNFLRQCLHCHRYSFDDQQGQKVSFVAPLLEDMKKVIP